jgi:hypothetical protein
MSNDIGLLLNTRKCLQYAHLGLMDFHLICSSPDCKDNQMLLLLLHGLCCMFVTVGVAFLATFTLGSVVLTNVWDC